MHRLRPWQTVLPLFSSILMCNQLKELEHFTMEKCSTGLKGHNKEAYIATCMHL